jgi:hypothetical protein
VLPFEATGVLVGTAAAAAAAAAAAGGEMLEAVFGCMTRVVWPFAVPGQVTAWGKQVAVTRVNMCKCASMCVCARVCVSVCVHMLD